MAYTLERWDLSDLFPGLESEAYARAAAATARSMSASTTFISIRRWPWGRH